jgi:hypothetical protein
MTLRRLHLRIVLLFASILLLATLVPAATCRAQVDVQVYSYFRGGWPTGGHSGVFLSYSTDGLNFESLNGGNAVFIPPEEWSDAEDQTRDPSVVYGPDGQFHMVWTSGITTRSIGQASSPNLRDWPAPQLVEIWDPGVTVANTWAPEILYDTTQQQYQIVFASNLNNQDHKLYSITTTDFNQFTDAELFYYNGVTVIDAMIAFDPASGQYLMPLKDEQNGQKNIRLATGPTPQGPWSTDNPIIVGPGSAIEGNVTEGPSLLQIGDTWFLYYDAYGAGYLGVATSTNPTDPSAWVNRTNQSTMPAGPNAHHGTVFTAPASAIAFDLFPFAAGDLSGDGQLDLDDWNIFQQFHLSDLVGLSPAEQQARGDLNGDGRNNHADFLLFKSHYNRYHEIFGGAAAGTDSFAALVSSTAVPEPATWLLACGLATLAAVRRAWCN